MKWKIYWTLVYAANLVLPLLLASFFVTEGGWIGTAVAGMGFWLAGLYWCEKNPKLIRRLVLGGILVGFSQFFGLPQAVAGVFAMVITRLVGAAHGRSITGPGGGLMATAITGALLLALAFVSGLAVEAIYERRHGKPMEKPQRDAGLDE